MREYLLIFFVIVLHINLLAMEELIFMVEENSFDKTDINQVTVFQEISSIKKPEKLTINPMQLIKIPHREENLVSAIDFEPEIQILTSTERKRISKKHALEKKIFPCLKTTCIRIFGTRKEQTDHFKRKHQKEKKYECKFFDCGLIYSTNPSLSLHIKRKHSEKKYACSKSQCEKRFAVKGDLNQHLKRAHEKIKK